MWNFLKCVCINFYVKIIFENTGFDKTNFEVIPYLNILTLPKFFLKIIFVKLVAAQNFFQTKDQNFAIKYAMNYAPFCKLSIIQLQPTGLRLIRQVKYLIKQLQNIWHLQRPRIFASCNLKRNVELLHGGRGGQEPQQHEQSHAPSELLQPELTPQLIIRLQPMVAEYRESRTSAPYPLSDKPSSERETLLLLET